MYILLNFACISAYMFAYIVADIFAHMFTHLFAYISGSLSFFLYLSLSRFSVQFIYLLLCTMAGHHGPWLLYFVLRLLLGEDVSSPTHCTEQAGAQHQGKTQKQKH